MRLLIAVTGDVAFERLLVAPVCNVLLRFASAPAAQLVTRNVALRPVDETA